MKSKESKIKDVHATHEIMATSITQLKTCESTIGSLNNYLEKRKEMRENQLNHWGEEGGCGCGEGSSSGSSGKVSDLVVLVDTSGSMNTYSKTVSEAMEKAIDLARETCDPDLRIEFFGVEGTFPSTIFATNHRQYLNSLPGAASFVFAADQGHVGLRQEQGANAVEDLSRYMDWREGACRAIFYISDEELDSVSPMGDLANENAVTIAAIKAANENDVTVFAHHVNHMPRDPQIEKNYRDLCEKTGGELYVSKKPTVEEYVDMLSVAICNACGKTTCKELDFPTIEPCISISWGDSDCDCIESSDHEIMSITVCNCYTNVTMSNFKITAIQVTDEEGKPVPNLPNGTPSVQLVPVGPYCFGNIEPCSCVSREFVLINEGAKEGKYRVNIQGVCFDVTQNFYQKAKAFELNICKD